MPKFLYQAYTNSQEKKEGIIEAANKTLALERIDKLSLLPISIKLADGREKEDIIIRNFSRISFGDIVIFSREVANLLDSGITVLAALLIVARQRWKPPFKVVIDKLIYELQQGRVFSEALAEHPVVFSRLYVSLVKSGETGGFLEEVMTRLSDFLENEQGLKEAMRLAMIYPALIAIVGIFTIFILLSFVIPKLIFVFQDLGQALPVPTQILVNISSFFNQYCWLVILFIALFYFVINRALNTHEGRLIFDRLKLRLPLLGHIILKRQIERFCRILATLLGNGVAILPSLEIVGDIMENNILKKEVEKIRIDVREGLSLSKAVGKSRYFPADIVNLVSLGEESGNLEKILKKISCNCEKEIDRSLKTFTSLLEPLMILVMGLIVAFIVTAMLLPIFQINFMIG